MQEIVLINLSGVTRQSNTDATAEIAAILARYPLRILDISQTRIHDNVFIGILLAIPQDNMGTHNPTNPTASVFKDVVFWASRSHLQVRFVPIDEHNYQALANAHETPRFILTLLARSLTATQIAAVTSVIVENGMRIENITRLSNIAPLSPPPDAKACIEFALTGEPQNMATLRASFLAVANTVDADIAFQKDNAYRRNRRLVVFDMDSTLIETEVINELADAAGTGAEVAAITERAMQGELDFQDSFRQRVRLLKGLDAKVLAEIGARLPLTEGAEKLIRTLKVMGYKTAIISGGFSYFGELLQQQLGIDYVFANALEIKDGQVTGNVTGTIVDGARKAHLLEQIVQQERLNLEQVIAVGDGANDLPMLAKAGLGIAFRAKAVVRSSAEQAISTLGLDSILYLLGIKDSDRFM